MEHENKSCFSALGKMFVFGTQNVSLWKVQNVNVELFYGFIDVTALLGSLKICNLKKFVKYLIVVYYFFILFFTTYL